MVISRGNNWIRQNAKTKDGKPIKAILSFADSAVGHKGSVYQSTNALYLGEQPPRPFHIVTNPATGKHSRVFSMKPTAMRKFKEMGYTIEKQLPESGKHKFLYVLGADQRERDQLEAKIKPQLYSYPKDDQPSKPIVNTAKQRVQSRPQQQTQPAAPQTKRDTIKKLLRTTIKNPETGHTILVQSALRYDKTSPVYRAAMGMVNAWSRKHGLKIKPTR
jgi:hypothetical protein